MDEDNAYAPMSHAATERTHTEVPRIAVKEPFKPIILPIKPFRDEPSCLVLPPGFTSHNVQTWTDLWEKAQPNPARRKGVYIAADLVSLLIWLEDQCDESAPVFAVGAEAIAGNWRKPVLAIAGIGNYSVGPEAHWHDFLGIYRFPVTATWVQWTASSGEWMNQTQFSEFVESHLYEFAEPHQRETLSEACTRMIEALGGSKAVASPSKMYEVSNGIKIMVSEQVEVELDRASGEQTLKFAETHTGKGGRPVAIPKFFFIRVPIFFGEEPSLVGVLLRYRNVGGGRVDWSYQLFAPDLVVKDAFDMACKVVRAAGRKLYMGTPDRPSSVSNDVLNSHY